jgi:hypothetical protein
MVRCKKISQRAFYASIAFNSLVFSDERRSSVPKKRKHGGGNPICCRYRCGHFDDRICMVGIIRVLCRHGASLLYLFRSYRLLQVFATPSGKPVMSR